MKRTASRQPTSATSPRAGSSRHLSLAEVCEDLGISRSTFYDWRAKRKAPPCFKLPNGDLGVRRVDFEAWLSVLEAGAAWERRTTCGGLWTVGSGSSPSRRRR